MDVSEFFWSVGYDSIRRSGSRKGGEHIRKQSKTTPIERPDWFIESVESSMVNETQDQKFFRDRGLRNANKSLYPYKKIQFKINQERFHSALWHQNEEKDCI